MIHRKTRAGLAQLRPKTTLAAILISVATLLVATEPAKAGSEIGQYEPAQVWCDSSSNTIWVTPRVGAGDNYTGQWIRYRFWGIDLEDGTSFWLGGSYWRTLFHQRVGPAYQNAIGIWMPGQVTGLATNAPTEAWPVSAFKENRGYHRFHVVAQYQWYSTTYRGYVGNATLETRSYSNLDYSISYFTGWAQAPDCYL